MAAIQIIIGEDDYLIEEVARKTIGDGVGLEIVDSINSTNADTQLADLRAADASFMTPPFLDPRKVTWWKNVHFLPQTGGKKVAEEVKAALEKFATKLAKAKLPSNQAFILSGPRLLRTSIFAKTLKASCEVIEFGGGNDRNQANAAMGRLHDFADEVGLVFAPSADEALLRRVGTDTRSIRSEIIKLRTYLGDEKRAATAADVDAISSPGAGVEPSLWSITDAIAARNAEAMARALKDFEGEDGFAIIVTGVTEKLFRDMAVMKEEVERGSAADAGANLAPFVRKKYMAGLGKWTVKELRLGRARMLRLREKIVQTGVSGDALVFMELLRIVKP